MTLCGFIKRIFIGATVAGTIGTTFVIQSAVAGLPTVGYMYSKIQERWNIDLGVDSIETPNSVFESKVLMQTIDKTNAAINQNGGTSYVLDQSLATHNIAATSHMMNTIENLVKPEFKFFFTPATNENTYTFEIGATGTFYIDWDDGGGIQTFVKNAVGLEPVSHTFADGRPASAHEIKLAGRATKYSTALSVSAIRFYDGNYYDNTTEEHQGKPAYVNPYQLKSMRGCLGCVFSTITDTSVAENARQPRFTSTFYRNTTLTSEIPTELFSGVTGAPVSNMFYATFYECNNLSGKIPAKLFAGITGTPASSMFYRTFLNCSGLNGEIPADLFAGITGTPAERMFSYTFYGCSGLTGIGGPLFAGISGDPAAHMFSATFYRCDGLTGSIPAGMFGQPAGAPAQAMFNTTFYRCDNLTGPIPAGLFGDISGTPAKDMFSNTFTMCGGLTGPIPAGLFGKLSGAPAPLMFRSTFSGCTGLTGEIPTGLFGNLSGAAAENMFYGTFQNCSGLTGQIPAGLFGNIYGPATKNMFQRTFRGCTGLTGPSPRVGTDDDKQYLYERWPDTTFTCVTTDSNGACLDYDGPSYQAFYNDTGLTDYDCIPTNWGGRGTKKPGQCEPEPTE